MSQDFSTSEYQKLREASTTKTEDFTVIGIAKHHVIGIRRTIVEYMAPLYNPSQRANILYTVMCNNRPIWFQGARRRTKGAYKTKGVAMKKAKWLVDSISKRGKCYATKDCQFCGKRNGMALAAAILTDKGKNTV